VRVLDTTLGKVIDTEDLFDQNVNALAYVNGDQHLLVGRKEDRKSSLFDAETLLPEGDDFEFATDWSTPIGDGGTAVVYRDDTVGSSEQFLVVDLNTREVFAEGNLDLYLYASDASPDGSTFVAAGNTGEIVAVDVSTGNEERRSANVGAEVRWLDYSSDGELLVSGAADGGVSLWDAASLELLGTVYPPRTADPVPSGAHFIDDTHDVAIASYDGRVYRWDTDLGRAIDYACQMAGRTLSEDEWATFLPAQSYQDVCPDL
jgi:WD40 repeat protein